MPRLPEQLVYDGFKRGVNSHLLKVLRVENGMVDGMSDTIVQNRRGTAAWIELKALESWPKRDLTCPLAHGIFRPGQIPFMESWIEWGGHAFVLLRVASAEYLLLKPSERLIGMTRSEILREAVCIGRPQIIAHLEDL